MSNKQLSSPISTTLTNASHTNVPLIPPDKEIDIMLELLMVSKKKIKLPVFNALN